MSICKNAKQCEFTNYKSGFFKYLSPRGLLYRLAGIHDATDKPPRAVIGSALKEQMVSVHDENNSGNKNRWFIANHLAEVLNIVHTAPYQSRNPTERSRDSPV